MVKFVRYDVGDNISRWGIINNENNIIEIEGDIFTEYTVTDKVTEISKIKILAPVAPSKIVAVGLNYRDHVEEMHMPLPEEPLIFLKPNTAVIGQGEKIILPKMSSQVEFEAELAIVISNTIKNITEAEVDFNILGYTCLNDVTARDLQKKDGQWTRAKSFDTFAPIGPCIVKGIDPDAQTIKLFLNGELKQTSNTSNFIFKTRKLVAYISTLMTLNRGDVITTGTPGGVGPMKTGDRVEVQIGEIGTLLNYVE
ncbi:MAG: fumarylacetoacetate hydrolase family protein [bacterium]